MIVVSDSSPLVTLSKLAYIDLLRLLFTRIYVSQEVHDEVVVSGAGLPGAEEVRASAWIEVQTLKNRAELTALQERYGLGTGELSAIALAKELRADVVLLDDLAARSVARQEGFEVRGTLGVLETSFLEGHIVDLRTAFARFLTYGYIDKRLLNIRLRALGLPPL